MFLVGDLIFVDLEGKARGGDRVDTDHINLFAQQLIKRTARQLFVQLLGQDVLGDAVETQLRTINNQLVNVLIYKNK